MKHSQTLKDYSYDFYVYVNQSYKKEPLEYSEWLKEKLENEI